MDDQQIVEQGERRREELVEQEQGKGAGGAWQSLGASIVASAVIGGQIFPSMDTTPQGRGGGDDDPKNGELVRVEVESGVLVASWRRAATLVIFLGHQVGS